MKKASQVIGLPVMGVAEGTTMGVASDFILDAANKRICYVVISTSKGVFGTYVLPIEKVMGVGNDYVMTGSLTNAVKIFESMDAMKMSEKGFFLMGAKVINCAGNVLGNVDGFSFDEKVGNILGITLDCGKAFNDNDLVAFSGGDMVFVNESADAVDIPVSAAPAAPAASAPAGGFDKEQRDFLLGRKVSEDISDRMGNVIIPSGTIINEGVLAKAEAADAMIELTLSAE